MNGSHAAVSHFMAQGGRGVLINMASIGGMFPTPLAASYAASKFGIAGFTDSLRAELAVRSEIEVCGVYPSFVDTPGVAHAANYSGRPLNGLRPNLHPGRWRSGSSISPASTPGAVHRRAAAAAARGRADARVVSRQLTERRGRLSIVRTHAADQRRAEAPLPEDAALHGALARPAEGAVAAAPSRWWPAVP